MLTVTSYLLLLRKSLVPIVVCWNHELRLTSYISIAFLFSYWWVGFLVGDRVAILLPTAGENLEVVFKALVGSLSQRLWDSGLPGSETLRIVVLDEKRRLEVYRVAAGVHRIGELLAGRRVQQILMVKWIVMNRALTMNINIAVKLLAFCFRH